LIQSPLRSQLVRKPASCRRIKAPVTSRGRAEALCALLLETYFEIIENLLANELLMGTKGKCMDVLETIVTVWLTLSSVSVGVLLNYWFLQRGKKNESELRIREVLLDKLDEWWRAHVKIQALIFELRPPLNKNMKTLVYSKLGIYDDNLTTAGWNFLKTWHRTNFYLKDKSLIKSVNELYKERTKFENLYGLTRQDMNKLSNIKFNNQLENQLKALYTKMDDVRNEILGFAKDGELRISTGPQE
jgi:hypothetical protein